MEICLYIGGDRGDAVAVGGPFLQHLSAAHGVVTFSTVPWARGW